MPCDCHVCLFARALHPSVESVMMASKDADNRIAAGGLAKLMMVQLLCSAVARRLKIGKDSEQIPSLEGVYEACDLDLAYAELVALFNAQVEYLNQLRAGVDAKDDPLHAPMPERTM